MRPSCLLYAGLSIFLFSMRTDSKSVPDKRVDGEMMGNGLMARQLPGNNYAEGDFLRRGSASAAVVGNWVYIDGGEFSFINNGATEYQYSNSILSIDLSKDWVNSTVTIQSTGKLSGTPNLNSPSLWYSEQEGLLYSGFVGIASNFGDVPGYPKLSLWTFKPDGTGSGTWNEVINNASSVFSGLTRPVDPMQAYGAGKALALGGLDPDLYIMPGMIEFDMQSRSFTNSSANTYIGSANASTGVHRGAMQYVPSFGPDGLFVVMGGETVDNIGGLIDFRQVSVYDPAKKQWFNQSTTGTPPSGRVDFCTAGVNSTNGTYEIFVYAGWGTTLGSTAIAFDQIFILTLPAFHWVQYSYNPQSPRFSLACVAIGGSQILTIGGIDANAKSPFHGTHKSTYNSSKDPFAQGLGIFDMTNLAWSSQYTAIAPPYQQSDPVKQAYAQPSNIATLTSGLDALMKVTHFTSVASNSTAGPTPSTSATTSKAPSSNAGAIAGGVVGGVVLFAIIGALAFFLRRRRRGGRTPAQQPEHLENGPLNLQEKQGNELIEIPNTERPAELYDQDPRDVNKPGASDWPAELDVPQAR